MGNIIDSVPIIDSITAKDGKTKEEILTVTTSDDSFDKMVEIYHFYYDLKWSEKVILKDDPFIEIDYIERNDVKFTVSIYQVEDHHISLLPNGFSTEVRNVEYSYSPEGSNSTYIFVIEELNQLIDVNDGMKVLYKYIKLNSDD
ncbi:hypothetical protein [Ornithinibacillus sp. 179-J 7C1 HS]|uniref:hypothetical protein n=1 Tax=Ornithinibacillus sp. 179-J 7C1 HS TaxID=3142384 RepID=UPI00399FB3C8